MNFLFYFEFFFFVSICLILIFIMFFLAIFMSPKNFTNEKVSVYECGFEPFSDARSSFDIHFYIVAILFIIFDIEIIFLIPWVLSISIIGFHGFLSMVLFLYLFLIGFIFEFKTNLISWISFKI